MNVRKQQGMTLVEILFAFAIIGTVVTVAYSSALRAWRTGVSANQRTQAQYMAQDQIERLRAYRDLSDSDTAQTEMNWNDFVSRVFARTIHIEPCAAIDNCVWKLVDNALLQTAAVGDQSGAYSVSLRAVRPYCTKSAIVTSETSTPGTCGGASQVSAVDVQAVVSWNDANGVLSNTIATTQLIAPSE